MKNISNSFFFLASFFLIVACHNPFQEHSHSETDAAHNHDGHHDDQEAHDDHATEEEEHHEDEVGLTTLQMEKIGLAFGSLEQKNLKSTIKVNGQLELPPQNQADVSTMAPGKITNILVKPGQYVKKGAALATLQNTEFIEWQQSFLETEAALLYLNKEWVRQKDLVSKQIAPQKQLDKIESERAIAQAQLKGLRSKLAVLDIATPTGELTSIIYLRSPISGYVRDIKVNTGTFVQPGICMFEIVDNHHLHIDLKVFEKDLSVIKNGQVIQFSLQSKPDEVMKAYIFAIGKALDEKQRTINVHAEIRDEKHQLLSGMFVEARIEVADRKVATLPNGAITVDKGLHYIFIKEEVHEDETHFMKVPVLKGVSDFGYTEVTPLEELPANVEIVTEGAYFLMAQSKKGEEGAGHHH